jgi:hypothetical protein
MCGADDDLHSSYRALDNDGASYRLHYWSRYMRFRRAELNWLLGRASPFRRLIRSDSLIEIQLFVRLPARKRHHPKNT